MESTRFIRDALIERRKNVSLADAKKVSLESFRHKIALKVLSVNDISDFKTGIYNTIPLDKDEIDAASELVGLINNNQPYWHASFERRHYRAGDITIWSDEFPKCNSLFAGPLFKPDKYADEANPISTIEALCLEPRIAAGIANAGTAPVAGFHFEGFRDNVMEFIAKKLAAEGLSSSIVKSDNGTVHHLDINLPEVSGSPTPAMRM